MDCNSEAERIIRREVNRIPGEKKWSGSSIFICCPFHTETIPSCGINMERGIPIGFFHCFGCDAKGGWNKLAEKLSLDRIKSYHTKVDSIVYEDHSADKELFGETKSMLDFAQEFESGIMTEFKKSEKWRSVSGKLLNKIGAKRIYDNKSRLPGVLLPVYVDKELVGTVKARHRKKKDELSYITSKGEWIKKSGLFPYDYVKKLIRKKDLKVVVLVEGPRDALRLISEGIPTLAILGAGSWSVSKRLMLERLGIEKVGLCFDGDNAGIKATNVVGKDIVGLYKVRVLKLAGTGFDPGDMPIEYVEKLKKLLKL